MRKLTEQNAKIKMLNDMIETEIKNIFTSENYAEYLGAAINLRRYSIDNIILVFSQMPDAKKIADFETWINYGRSVKRGETGIQILAPELYTVMKNDGETTLQKLKIVYLYDISQTEGLPLIAEIEYLPADVHNCKVFIESLKRISPIPIKINKDLSEIETICAVINDIAHAKTDSSLEAESIFYTVCRYYGIEAGTKQFDDITEWSSTHEISEMKSLLDSICKISSEIIDDIDDKFRELIMYADELADEMPVTENNEPAETEIDIMPDPSIGFAERNSYGYTKADMLPLSQDKAIELYNDDYSIYMLYPDNTEGMVAEPDEIYGHDGLFGIRISEWAAYSAEYTEKKEFFDNIESVENTGVHYDYEKENISVEISGQSAVTNNEIITENTVISKNEAVKKTPAKPPQKNNFKNRQDKSSLLGMLERNKAMIAKKSEMQENSEKEQTF